MFLECKCPNAKAIYAMKNLVCCSGNLLTFTRWRNSSPPLMNFMIKYILRSFWNTYSMFTMKGWST